MKNYKVLFNKFKTILSLTNEPIKLKILPGTTNNLLYGSNIHWDNQKNRWILEYVEDLDFYLIHELGHIYYSILLKCPYFAKQTPVPVNVKIGNYNVSIVDCFVNYQLSIFNEIYPIYIEFLDKALKINDQEINPNIPFFLAHYLNFFLEINYNLREKEKKIRIKTINTLFFNFEKLLLNNKILDSNQLNQIKEKCNQYNDIKSSKNPKEVITFITQLLKLIPFWTENEVDNTMRKTYNI